MEWNEAACLGMNGVIGSARQSRTVAETVGVSLSVPGSHAGGSHAPQPLPRPHHHARPHLLDRQVPVLRSHHRAGHEAGVIQVVGLRVDPVGLRLAGRILRRHPHRGRHVLDNLGVVVDRRRPPLGGRCHR